MVEALPPDARVPSLSIVPSAPIATGTGAHLPTLLTPLIAREQELAAVVSLLHDPGVRLLTLTDPGGVGKTRLAVAAATDVMDDFRDGVAFVNLAPIASPDLVLDTIAGALGLRDMGTVSLLDRLIDVLAGRSLLLVLDNFEQVVTAGPRVRELLDACPEVKLLITSRIGLRLSGEREFPVAPLPLPQSVPVAGGDLHRNRVSRSTMIRVALALPVGDDGRIAKTTNSAGSFAATVLPPGRNEVERNRRRTINAENRLDSTDSPTG